MRKNISFLALSLLVLIFFACEFITPTAVEIKGSPSLRFSERVNIGKMFTDLLEEAITGDDKMEFFPCKQTADLTYLIYMDLYNEEFEAVENEQDWLKLNFPGMDIPWSEIGSALPNERVLIDGVDDAVTLPLLQIGTLLEGFQFSGYKTKLYFSGSDFVGKAKVDITIQDVVNGVPTGVITKIGDGLDISNRKSDVETWETNGYNGTSYPSDGVEVAIPIEGKDIAVSFKVYIPAGQTLTLADFAAGSVKVEIVVWLPFVFEAVTNDAEISFPEDALFSSKDDLFGRDKPGADSMMTDVIESLSLEIMFDKNPFTGSDLIVFSKGDEGSSGIEIKNPITGRSLSFAFSENDMKRINAPENWPFTPNFKMKFRPGATLEFPREFYATDLRFNAKIRYKMDL